MKNKIFLLTVLLVFLPSLVVADDEICWRETETRGVGTIPRECDLVEERQALTCYAKCREGYTGLVAKCRMDCPEGFKEGVLNYCLKTEDYRVAGFPWKAGDGLGATKLNNARERCEITHGKDGCVQRQSAWYPRCNAGFSQAGINICRQACPAGWQQDGNRCLRPNYVRNISKPRCEAGKEYRAGLCRDACPAGYYGVGPVCWQNCPTKFPTQCGMACATSKDACALGVTDQVMSVLDIALNIAELILTGGASSIAKGIESGVEATIETATKFGARAAARQAARSLRKVAKKEIKRILLEAIKDPEQALVANEAIQAIVEGQLEDGSPGDRALSVFAAIDPTGISAAVDAYKKPICPL